MCEPLMKCRKVLNDVKTRMWSLSWEKPGRNLSTDPGGIRLIGGVNLRQAFVWNVGTLSTMLRESTKWPHGHKVQSTNAWVRGGWIRSSGEGS